MELWLEIALAFAACLYFVRRLLFVWYTLFCSEVHSLFIYHVNDVHMQLRTENDRSLERSVISHETNVDNYASRLIVPL